MWCPHSPPGGPAAQASSGHLCGGGREEAEPPGLVSPSPTVGPSRRPLRLWSRTEASTEALDGPPGRPSNLLTLAPH